MNYFQPYEPDYRSAMQRALAELLRNMPTKRKVFVSFHHANDQVYFNAFKKHFCDEWEILSDASLGINLVNSYDEDYVKRAIREDYIKGSSVTIVLCGRETFKRMFVDAEIYYTLLYDHALLGIILPTAAKNLRGQALVPDRLADNINSGYAHWINWTLDPQMLKAAIEVAIQKKSTKTKINNRVRLKTNLQ